MLSSHLLWQKREPFLKMPGVGKVRLAEALGPARIVFDTISLYFMLNLLFKDVACVADRIQNFLNTVRGRKNCPPHYID